MIKMEEIVMAQFRNNNPKLDDFETFFKEDHFIFYMITSDEKFHNKIFDYIKEKTEYLTSKPILFIDDIDKKWASFNRLLKSILILLTQQKEISLQKFSYIINGTNSYYYCCWGIEPLPSMEAVINDSKKQLKQGQII